MPMSGTAARSKQHAYVSSSQSCHLHLCRVLLTWDHFESCCRKQGCAPIADRPLFGSMSHCLQATSSSTARARRCWASLRAAGSASQSGRVPPTSCRRCAAHCQFCAWASCAACLSSGGHRLPETLHNALSDVKSGRPAVTSSDLALRAAFVALQVTSRKDQQVRIPLLSHAHHACCACNSA